MQARVTLCLRFYISSTFFPLLEWHPKEYIILNFGDQKTAKNRPPCTYCQELKNACELMLWRRSAFNSVNYTTLNNMIRSFSMLSTQSNDSLTLWRNNSRNKIGNVFWKKHIRICLLFESLKQLDRPGAAFGCMLWFWDSIKQLVIKVAALLALAYRLLGNKISQTFPTVIVNGRWRQLIGNLNTGLFNQLKSTVLG